MNWSSYFPTKVFFGSNAVRDNYAVLENLGKRALIVTGKGGSAQRSGALDDVGRALEQLSIKWEVFNEVEANPSIQTVRKGAAVARSFRLILLLVLGAAHRWIVPRPLLSWLATKSVMKNCLPCSLKMSCR
jgi:alcohol dehydrogenase class IV